MVAQVRYSVAGRSGGRVMLCAVCTVHKETISVDFLVEPENQGQRFYQWFDIKTTGAICQGFGLKTTGTVFPGLASKPVVMVCQGFGLKTTGMVFPGLASKSVAMVSPSLTSKPVVTGFLVWASKPAATFC
jgi:hypothetical protein